MIRNFRGRFDAHRYRTCDAHPFRRFFFVLFSSLRFSVNLFPLDRPLVVGLVYGAVFGDIPTCMNLAVFFELFWLDLFPAGTYIPPNQAAATLAALTLARCYGQTEAPGVLVASAMSLPLALIFARLEAFHRRFETTSQVKARDAAERHGVLLSPGRLIRRSLTDMAIINGVCFSLALAGLVAAGKLLFAMLDPILARQSMSYAHLWILGSLGGVLSLRHRPAYVVLSVGVAFAVVWFLVLT
ncbi:PTS sugar transporter subunit IIC [Desulfolutivibrio sulfoxidireducens]|uniref:PTS sugar transporter subunit IIC n=1 Tax=Desulfolutivibrio sulfoxidireducens TaxID=2773299 RepID=UPI00159DA250